MIDTARYPNVATLIDAQLQAFPEHETFLQVRFRELSAENLKFADDVALLILRIAGENLEQCCADYRWLTQIVLEEEIFFRRENRYRLTTFAEALANVYSDRVYMTRYMNGLLLSQLWWANHTQVLHQFRDVYLPAIPAGASHLEIGPGHGLYLYLAASGPQRLDVSSWDVSEASLDLVRASFAALGLTRPVTLSLTDMFEPSTKLFDSITLSEVLEHLEEPDRALATIARLLKPGGHTFINVPVNSPAPDHITLYRAPEDAVAAVAAAGLEIVSTMFAPATGASLARARKLALTISTAIIARKP
jgi:2-polyprenyl-3-methyl-5-hydroxy-6-metoxy-1,4-benzoquinol methylase